MGAAGAAAGAAGRGGAASAARSGAATANAGTAGSAAPSGFAGFAEALQGMIPTVTQLTNGVDAASAAFKATALSVVNATQAVIDFGKQISKYVQLASPAHVVRFTAALDDMNAMIGRGLVPVMELVTKVIRNVADSMGALAPIGANIARGLEPFQRALSTIYEWFGRLGNQLAKLAGPFGTAAAIVGEAFDAFMKALEPLGDLLIDLVGGLLTEIIGTHGPLEIATAYVVGFTRALGDLTRWLADNVRRLLALVGIDLPNDPGTKPGSSVGAAARSAQIGSVESAIAKAMTSAYSLGTAANPAERTANATEELNKKAEQVRQAVIAMARSLETLPQRIADAIRAVPSQAREAISAGVQRGQGIVEEAVGRLENFTQENFAFKPSLELGRVERGVNAFFGRRPR